MANPSERLNPSFTEEQEAAGVPEELPSVIMGPPAYASPDPRTASAALLPLEEHPLSADLSPDYGQDEIDAGNVTSLPSTMDAEGAGGFQGGDPRAEFGEDGPETKADWQKLAKSYGLSTSGSKAVLQERVEEHEAALDADANMTAAEWKDEVDEAESAEELANIRARYAAAGADYSTVQDALDKRQAELESDEEQ